MAGYGLISFWGTKVEVSPVGDLLALGAVKTSVYIYLVPVTTVISSVLVLHEKISGPGWGGILLTLAGLLISEYRGKS